jgi:hypothetical protein
MTIREVVDHGAVVTGHVRAEFGVLSRKRPTSLSSTELNHPRGISSRVT